MLLSDISWEFFFPKPWEFLDQPGAHTKGTGDDPAVTPRDFSDFHIERKEGKKHM